MTGEPIKTFALALIGFALAGAAHAEAASQPSPPPLQYSRSDAPARLALDLSGPGAALALPYGQDRPATMSDFPRTAVDHAFATDKVTGSFGYLCGLHPGPDAISGPAASSDPVGTFLGAKLSYTF